MRKNKKKFKMFCNNCNKIDYNNKMHQHDDIALCDKCEKDLRKEFPKKEDFEEYICNL